MAMLYCLVSCAFGGLGDLEGLGGFGGFGSGGLWTKEATCMKGWEHVTFVDWRKQSKREPIHGDVPQEGKI